MEQNVKIRCKNNKKALNVAIGSTLYDIYRQSELQMDYAPMAALVNNKLEGLDYRVYHPKTIEFLGLNTPAGIRTYTRTLFFVLCKAVYDLYPDGSVTIGIPVSNGYCCDLQIGHAVTQADIDALLGRMQQIAAENMPIRHYEVPTSEATELFRSMGMESKAQLIEGIGRLYTTYYELGGYINYFYGALLPNTGMLSLFGLEMYFDCALLRIPSANNPSTLGEKIRQDKMFEVFKEHHRLQNILGVDTIGSFNNAIKAGYSTEIINVSEALQEKKIAQIANQIAARKEVRMVLIAGPSSSGKTTTCKRLSIQLLTNGIKPVPISLDDYFVNRTETPRDESGDYDYENLHALNLPLLNRHLAALFNGEEVELPKYDFTTGRSISSGRRLRLSADEVLVVEGIHALNPELTASIPQEQKFRVYASALTSILLDNHNYIPTTDNRLLRRIVRDYKYRAVSAQETIRRWPSVRAGENKWIFPYQEEADAMFNTAMIYELAVLRTQAERILEQVPENCAEYAEAYRLRKFLRYILPVNDKDLPQVSLLREFLGGSAFKY